MGLGMDIPGNAEDKVPVKLNGWRTIGTERRRAWPPRGVAEETDVMRFEAPLPILSAVGGAKIVDRSPM